MGRMWEVTEAGYVFSKGRVAEEPAGEIILNRLEMMSSCELAEAAGDGYVVSHEAACALGGDDKTLLGLPPDFPYRLSVSDVAGDIGHDTLRYQVLLLQPDGSSFVNPEIIGSYVRIDKERQYLLSSEQYGLRRAAADANRTIQSIRDRQELMSHNLLKLAEIKKHAGESGSKVSRYLKETKVKIPDKISVNFSEDKFSGKYYPEPILLEKGEEENSFAKIEDEAFSRAFARDKEVRACYLGKEGVKYVFPDEVKKGLTLIKETKPLNREEYDRFLVQPQELFEDEIFAFPDGVYSERVIGFIGTAYRGYAVEKLNEGDWLPAEGESSEFWAEFAVNPENLVELDKKIEEAAEKGKSHIEFGGQEIALNHGLKVELAKKKKETAEKLQEAEEKGQAYIETVDGKKFPITPELRKAIGKYLKKPIKGENGQPLEKRAPCIEPRFLIKANDDKLDYTPEREGRQVIPHLKSGLKPGVSLYDHQQKGVSWLYEQWRTGFKGVLLADDMGLGKTIQALAFVTGIWETFANHDGPVLIVAPVSLLKNWSEEIKKYVDEGVYGEIVELHSQNLRKFKKGKQLDLEGFAENHKRCFVQTTYETLRKCQLEFGRISWNIIIADEAQKIKNPSANQTQALKAMQYDFAVTLSGTPVENSWVDLWSIMDFAQPGKLGEFVWFRENFHNQLAKNKHDKEFVKNLGEQLMKKVDPLLLRRLKKDILDALPEKEVREEKYPMPERQRKAYNAAIAGFRFCDANLFKVIAKLRDISLHPNLADATADALARLADKDPNGFIQSSARLKKTFEILYEVREKQEKALVFVVSKKMQIVLQFLLEKIFAIQVQTPINGDMEGDRRQAVIDAFACRTGFAVLILSPEAAGVGLNITCANHVIHLSRTWNPAKEEQATDRVYRIGQQKKVMVYIPMAVLSNDGSNESFDEKLNELLNFKRKLSDSVLLPTEDSAGDMEIFRSIIDKGGGEVENAIYYNIDELGGVTGDKFEWIVRQLCENKGYDAIKTPASGDQGADVVAFADQSRKSGYLIQCKLTSVDRNLPADGISEVVGALPLYRKKYDNCDFLPVVVTNAPNFTEGARERAKANRVRLIVRDELAGLLRKYPVAKG